MRLERPGSSAKAAIFRLIVDQLPAELVDRSIVRRRIRTASRAAASKAEQGPGQACAEQQHYTP